MIKHQPLLRSIAATIAIAAGLANAQKAHAQFTTGNIVVLQVGDGSAALTNASAPVYLKEFTPTGAAQTTPVSTVTVPVVGGHKLVNSGSATSEGYMSLSADSLRITLAGYDTLVGVASVNSTTSAVVPRVIDTVSISGVAGRAASTITNYSANNIRSAVRGIGENYYGSGTGAAGLGGTYYFGNTAAATSIQTTVNNARVINASGGNLYFSTASGTIGIWKITGIPTTAVTPVSIIPTGSSGSPYGFSVNPGETIAYVADDRTSVLGGVQKWVYTGGAWSTTVAYTLSVGTGTGARGVTTDWSGTYPVIYATTTDNRLVRLVDSSATAVFTLLSTAPTNTAFRGVTFAPKCSTPVLSTTVTNRSCAANGSVVLNVTSGTTPSTYSWTGPSSFTASTQNITNLLAGTYNVTVTTPGGCTATTSAIITNPTFTATATAGGATSVCTGDSVTLSANTGTGYTYQWNNASGIIPGATSATYKAGANGAYTVTVSSGTNCTATSTPAIAVTVNPLPVVSVVAGAPVSGVTQICGTVTPSGTYTYQWRLNGVPIVGATALCYNATVTGSYCLYATSGSGCTGFSCTSITACTAPTANVTPAGPLALCPGNNVTLHTNNAAGLTYQWKNNGTNVATGGTDSTYVVSTAGSYTVVVTAGAGCSTTSSAVVVSISALPATTITAISASPICAGDTIRLKTVSATGATYGWSVNGNLLPAQTDSLLKARAVDPLAIPVTVSIRAIVTSAAGCKDSSAVQSVVINPRPSPAVTIYDSLRFCQGDSVILSVSTGTGYVHAWSQGGVIIPGSVNDSITIMTAGLYRAIVTNSYGCSDSSMIHPVVVVPLPTPVATYSGGILSATSGLATYQWYLNGTAIGSATSASYTPAANGSYTVVVTNTDGCAATSAAVTVNDLAVHGFHTASVSIYPNPVQEVVYVKAGFAVNVTIKDMDGRIVRNANSASQVNVAGLAAGIYSINIYTTGDELLLTQKLVKAQ